MPVQQQQQPQARQYQQYHAPQVEQRHFTSNQPGYHQSPQNNGGDLQARQSAAEQQRALVEQNRQINQQRADALQQQSQQAAQARAEQNRQLNEQNHRRIITPGVVVGSAAAGALATHYIDRYRNPNGNYQNGDYSQSGYGSQNNAPHYVNNPRYDLGNNGRGNDSHNVYTYNDSHNNYNYNNYNNSYNRQDGSSIYTPNRGNNYNNYNRDRYDDDDYGYTNYTNHGYRNYGYDSGIGASIGIPLGDNGYLVHPEKWD